MKRHPLCRICFFLFTVAVFAAAPIVHRHYSEQLHGTYVAESVSLDRAPIAGQSFPVAGQDEAPPKIGIVLRAQEDAEVGELVRLDASDSDVDALTWQIIPATPDFEVIENGRRAFFTSRVSGDYLIIIAAAKEGQPFLQHHTIRVVGGPEPGPPTADTLASKVRRWTKKVPNYERRAIHAAAIAAVFRKLATADDVSVDQMLEATATANSAILGDDLDQWLPLLEPLGEELDVITEAGNLETRDHYKTVWLKIAEGIEQGA